MKIISQNKKAHHDYFLLDTYEAGIELKEILKITNKLKEGGLTVVPTKMYFSGSKAKLEIALAKGKKLYDKRNDLKEKAAKRDIEKSLKNYY